MSDPTSSVDDAVREADEAAERAGIAIRDVHEVAGFEQMRLLFNQVWHAEPGADLVNTGLLTALAHSGNYCVAAYQDDDRTMVGASAAWLGRDVDGFLLHSHITGVVADAVSGGIGRALKLHQRSWALQLDVPVITWTFDPLIRRNAHFNINKLGAQLTEYLVDFYGPMNDGLNAGQPSDRMLCRWDLRNPFVPTPAGPIVDLVVDDGGPTTRDVDPDGGLVGVQIPPDIEDLRSTDPALAARWRVTVRDVLRDRIDHGWKVVGLDDSGRYLVAPPHQDPSTRTTRQPE